MKSSIVTTPGVLRPLFWLSGPVLLEQLLNALVGFVDTWLTGHFIPGEAPLAAVGLMSYTMWLLPSLFASIAIGSTALIARFVGAGDMRLARQALHQSLFCGIILAGLVFAALQVFDVLYISALNLRGPAAELALRYLHYITPVIPAMMLVQVGIACLRGAGDTISGFVAMACLNVVNMVVGALLVTGWGPFPCYGWDGLAIGTAAGYVTGAVVVLVWLLRGQAGLQLRGTELKPSLAMIRRLLRVGVPGGADVAAVLACQLWFVRIINGLGTLPAAAHMLAIRVESLAYLPGVAFQVAAATMVGQYLGDNDPRRAMRGVVAACAAACGFMIAAGFLFYFGAAHFTAFFTGSYENETAITAVPLLQLAAWAMPCLAITMVLSGALRGAGDTRWPFYITLIGFLGVRIPLAMIVTSQAVALPVGGFSIPAGVYGAWCAMVLDLAVRTVISLGRLFHGGWRSAQV